LRGAALPARYVWATHALRQPCDEVKLANLGGVSAFLDGFGHAWRVAERAPGVLYAGTDEGLLVIRAPGAERVVERAPADGELPPFRR
jgi:hypothetical protein